MNIHNIDLVYRLKSQLEGAKDRLRSLENFPHMVSVTYSGSALGAQPTKHILPELKAYYQLLIDEATQQLMELGVDLSPLPTKEEEEECP